MSFISASAICIRQPYPGSMLVDDEPTYTGAESLGFFTGLHLVEDMYLGSVPDYNAIPKVAGGIKEGFVGKKQYMDDKKTPDEKKKKKTTRSIDLPVESWVAEFTKEQLNLLIEKENQMIMQDRLEKERCDAKNTVEEYVYDMRDKLCGPLEEFSKEEDRENFNKFLGETEDWLYDEGEDQNKQVYIDKFKELAKSGDPIVYRYRESYDRPVAFAELGSGLQSVRKFLDLYEANDEKYDHLEKADVDKVKKCVEEKQEWFDKQMNANGRLKKYENPTVMASQIRQTSQSLESTCSPIMTKPKPKPKEEPPKDEKKADVKEETKENQEKASGDAVPTTEPAKEGKSEGMMDLD